MTTDKWRRIASRSILSATSCAVPVWLPYSITILRSLLILIWHLFLRCNNAHATNAFGFTAQLIEQKTHLKQKLNFEMWTRYSLEDSNDSAAQTQVFSQYVKHNTIRKHLAEWLGGSDSIPKFAYKTIYNIRDHRPAEVCD